MPSVEKYGLYLASWEYLYLGTGIPCGLPNSVFSHHPWVLILFENIYCDENGLKGEVNAHKALQWTNSGLFRTLCAPTTEVIQTLPMKAILNTDAGLQRIEYGSNSAEDFQSRMFNFSDSELEERKIKLLRPFIEKNNLFLYDFPMSRSLFEEEIPLSVRKAVQDMISLRSPDILLSLRMGELSDVNQSLFNDLQEFEKEPLFDLKRIGISIHESEYLPYLTRNRHRDYQKIDIELSEGVDQRLKDILVVRERFGRRGGWQLVRRYFDAKYSPTQVPPNELGTMEREIVECVRRSILPTMRERGLAIWHITKAAISFVPILGQAKSGVDLLKAIQEAKQPFKDTITFYRSRSRKQLSQRDDQNNK